VRRDKLNFGSTGDRLQVELVMHNPLHSVSGIGRYVRELYRHLSDRIPVRLVTPIDPPLASRFTFLHQLPLGLRGHRPSSIVHFTQIMGCSQMLWHPVHPAVATVHDLGVLVCKEDEVLFNRFDRWMLDLQLAGLKRMDRFVADSTFTRRCLIEALGIPEQRIHVIHLGVDREHFRPVAQARTRIAERYNIWLTSHTHNLLYVGSEQPRKNLGVLLSALAKLKSQGYHLRLIKVGRAGGERWRERFLADVQRFQLNGDVVVVNNVPEPDLPLFYNAVDLYVNSSLLEGFGLPILEAMSCGTPVICSNAGSLPEIVGDVAVLINPRDPDSLVTAIAAVLDDPAFRESMRRRGLAQSASFTWEKSIDKLIEVYRSIRRRD